MPAQNSRSIWIRCGAIGTVAFLFRFGSGGSIAVGGVGGAEGAGGAGGGDGAGGADFVFVRFRFGWAGSGSGAGSGADSGAGSGAAGSGAGGVSVTDSMAASEQVKTQVSCGVLVLFSPRRRVG